jgi:hypothetical protein
VNVIVAAVIVDVVGSMTVSEFVACVESVLIVVFVVSFLVVVSFLIVVFFLFVVCDLRYVYVGSEEELDGHVFPIQIFRSF